jgi:uncharacterized LabA/DUF88 family protein
VSNDRLKIAVFIDFDNIEIGVRTSLGGHFDVGAVLEAVKERGEVVTKVAYGDWTRATDYGRSMSQHAIHMVQRNLTPGGDKNGADINLALDALEMAFTHNHINAFVIVGGDSDFITLVEKLKQYDRKVFVVGGRSFTSHVMQKNCTEFVAYEDIVGSTGRGRHAGERTRPLTDIAAAMPLMRRALALLADREMTPQLGLLKSTLLQLDSSFSEKAYGVTSFRDFVEKLAKAGYVALKGTDRSFYVELREAGEPSPSAAAALPAAGRRSHRVTGQANEDRVGDHGAGVPHGHPSDGGTADAAQAPPFAAAPPPGGGEIPAPEDAPRIGPIDGYRIMERVFVREGAHPRFPMYVRQVKQFIKTVDESFDERRYGFAGILDALRFGQREGLFRLERDRHGGVRVHPGPQYLKLRQPAEAAPADEPAVAPTTAPEPVPLGDGPTEALRDVRVAETPPPEPPPVEGGPTLPAQDAEETSTPPVAEEPPAEAVAAAPEPATTPRRPARKRTASRTGTRTTKAATARPAAKKTPRPRAKKA